MTTEIAGYGVWYGELLKPLAKIKAKVAKTLAKFIPKRNQGKKGPFARLLTSNDGGPVRRIVNGRQTKYTGFFISVKADFAQMPWESRRGEKPALVLCEASARVISLLAQPHRLEILVNEQTMPLTYFPDLQLRVHPSFVDDLRAGVPFSAAALAPSQDEPDDRLVTLIIEIKDDRDARQNKPRYKRKLELAKQVYRSIGMEFLIIHRAEDLFPGDVRIASSVVSWRHTAVSQMDVWAVEKILRRSEKEAAQVVAALGGEALGWGKLRALHVRRYVDIDLTETVSPETVVRLPKHNSAKTCVRY
ncbi:hypothetical protein QTL95_21225 [Rhizobium sp. S152]|uniref:hypothetical protein n=1 Tax=Rhizobium sp. S152 TaxID=3055038 RepID=UPI0025A9F846|nr:hypothetical protein [Rhizobium sp. S152]MDM9628423.1 hypothetical protein [Rhizobium sp. S152]